MQRKKIHMFILGGCLAGGMMFGSSNAEAGATASMLFALTTPVGRDDITSDMFTRPGTALVRWFISPSAWYTVFLRKAVFTS